MLRFHLGQLVLFMFFIYYIIFIANFFQAEAIFIDWMLTSDGESQLVTEISFYLIFWPFSCKFSQFLYRGNIC